MTCRSRISMALILLGVPINRLSTGGDKTWWKKYEDLHPALKAFLIIDVKIAYLSYNVLLVAIREECIPDPDIWCKLTRTLQRPVLRWWGRWVFRTIRGVKVASGELRDKSSRSEALTVLRAVGHDDRLLDHPPYRVLLMAEVRKGGVTLSRGGERFLHVARERALTQFRIFKSEPIPAHEHLFDYPITNEILLVTRYFQPNTRTITSRPPVPKGTEFRFLNYHPKLALREVIINPDEVSVKYMLDVFRSCARPQKEGILEWGRFNPDKISHFFSVFLKDTMVSKKYRSIYEPLRMIALHVNAEHPVEVPAIEDNIKKYQDEELRSCQQEMDDIQAQIDTLMQRRQQAELDLRDVMADIQDGKGIDRSRWRGPDQPRSQRRLSIENDEAPETAAREAKQPSRRRGLSPGERVDEQVPAVLPTFPARLTSHIFPGAGWKDDDESFNQGSMKSSTTLKRKTPSPAVEVIEQRTIRELPDEVEGEEIIIEIS